MRVRLLLLVLTLAPAGALAVQPFVPLLQPGDAVPDFALVAQNGQPFTLGRLRGNAVAVSFVYTRCADARMCPLVSAKFARAQAAIGTAHIRLLIVTLDPGFDTPPVLMRYGRAFGQNARYWTLATGAGATIEALAERFGIATAVARPGTILHTEGLMIVAPDGRLATSIDGNAWTAADLITFARATLPGQRTVFTGVRAWLSSALERCGGGNMALGATAMVGLLMLMCGVVGAAFWFAFGSRTDRTT